MDNLNGDIPQARYPWAGGTMGDRIRSFDWSSAGLDQPGQWPGALKTLIDVMLGSSQPMFVVWGMGRTLIHNDAYSAILANKSEDALGRDFLEVWHEIRGDLVPIVEQVLRGEPVQSDDIELWMERKGFREETHFSFSYTPVRGGAGSIDGFFCVCQEITGQVMAERQLRETTRRMDAILNNTREAVFLMDHNQHCIFANRAAERLTGYTFEQLQGQPLHDVIHCKKPDGSHYPLEKCLIVSAFPARAQMSGEEFFVAPDGSFYPVAFTASPVLDDDGEPIGTVVEARNIAEEKAAEAEQRETQERYRLAARATNDAIWDWNLTTGDVQWNEAVHTLFGYDEEEVEASGDWWIGHIHEEDRELVDKSIHAAIDGTASHWAGEYRFLAKDGSHVDIFDRGFVIRNEQGQAVRMIGAMQDLTERRRAEEALRELNERLEQRVAAEVAERNKAQEALRQAQKMEAVGQLTGGIAHDFNNLLTVVTGNIDMASRALAASGDVDPRAERALESALKGAERAAALTQRLLAFSRRQPLAPKALDADRLVVGMSDLVQRALGEMVKLEVVTSPGLWRVEADPNQLESAILNLAVNARDAMPEGGTLTIETANARLDEAYTAEHAEVAPGYYVMIAVTDTGVGMGKDVAARVFEPFYTTKEVGKGTGLGLSMVYGFTKQSGGHVKIYSEEGHGTTVKIYLPRVMADIQAEEVSAESRPEVSQAQECILVVEDDDDVRSYTVECLRELGYRVLEAHDGEAALRVYERDGDQIDLLFTDVVMPGMTGRELADKVRNFYPHVKILFTSGYTRDAIVHGGRLDEGVEIISKPFTYTTLAQKIADVLDKGRTGRILLVGPQPTLRAFAFEALMAGGYVVDEAHNATEALAKVRASRGSFDAILLDGDLPGQAGHALALELRKLHIDLPILIAGENISDIEENFAADRCTGMIAKPYNAANLLRALASLGVRCRGSANE